MNLAFVGVFISILPTFRNMNDYRVELGDGRTVRLLQVASKDAIWQPDGRVIRMKPPAISSRSRAKLTFVFQIPNVPDVVVAKSMASAWVVDATPHVKPMTFAKDNSTVSDHPHGSYSLFSSVVDVPGDRKSGALILGVADENWDPELIITGNGRGGAKFECNRIAGNLSKRLKSDNNKRKFSSQISIRKNGQKYSNDRLPSFRIFRKSRGLEIETEVQSLSSIPKWQIDIVFTRNGIIEKPTGGSQIFLRSNTKNLVKFAHDLDSKSQIVVQIRPVHTAQFRSVRLISN